MAVLAIDQGTSGTKAIVVDESGAVLAVAEESVRPDYREGGVVEQNPRELLISVLTAGQRACDDAGVMPTVVSLANQGETVLAWNPYTGEPLTEAMVWQDSRAESICSELRDDADDIAQRTGLVLDPYFSAPKMAWLRRHLSSEGVVTTTDTWLLHHLTGEFVTDVATASRSLLIDIDSVSWDAHLLELFSLGGESLPRLVACDEVIGTTSVFGGEATVAGAIVDQQAALLAEACLNPGEAKCTYGTGAFVLANTGSLAVRSTARLTTSVAWRVRGTTSYCVDGQVYTAASALRWLIDLGVLSSAEHVDATASTSSDGVMFVPGLAGLAAPWWHSSACGALTGMSLSTTSGHIVRAVIEGIAAQVAEVVAVMGRDLGVPLTSLRVDGGMTASRTLLQAQADLAQVPVEVYPSAHATALGAAALGRLATEQSLTVTDAVSHWTPLVVVEPQWSRDRASDFLGRWGEAVNRAREVS